MSRKNKYSRIQNISVKFESDSDDEKTISLPKNLFSDGQSNLELETLASCLGSKLREQFIGVFSKDELPRIGNNQCVILNLEDSVDKKGNPMPGSHWISCGIHNKTPWYFDSFGLPILENLKHIVKPPIYYNAIQIQDSESGKCGIFALLACYFISTNLNKSVDTIFEKFISYFDNPDLKANDAKLDQMLVSILKNK